MPKKSYPRHIDPANPQTNFVEATYLNHGDKEGFHEYMYGPSGTFKNGKYTPPPSPGQHRPAHHYGHSIGQRAGKLRLSGVSGAHRIGKRSK